MYSSGQSTANSSLPYAPHTGPAPTQGYTPSGQANTPMYGNNPPHPSMGNPTGRPYNSPMGPQSGSPQQSFQQPMSPSGPNQPQPNSNMQQGPQSRPYQPGMPGMQPGMPGSQPGIPGMQSGMPRPQSGMQLGMPGSQPGMQSGTPNSQSGMQPGTPNSQSGMQYGMQSGPHSSQSGIQPGMQPGMQSGMAYPPGSNLSQPSRPHTPPSMAQPHSFSHHRKYQHPVDAAAASSPGQYPMSGPMSNNPMSPSQGPASFVKTGLPNLGAPNVGGPSPAFLGTNNTVTQGGYKLGPSALNNPQSGMMSQQQSFRLSVNLFQTINLVPVPDTPAPVPVMTPDVQDRNCPSRYMRCTLTALPATSSLLTKCKLPLGLHVFPYATVKEGELPVIQPSTIVRCRSCRTYINPFVTFTENGKTWRCCMCFRANEVPQDFEFDPVTRQMINRNERAEIRSAMVEYIAPTEYMVRPPQPSVHLFLIDVSAYAIESGMVAATVQTIKENISKLPGDDRRMVGFITYDSALHFYCLKSTQSQPQMYVVTDLDEVFLPSPSDLLVNYKESAELVHLLLDRLPSMFSGPNSPHSALGPAMNAAFKLMSPTGGKMMIFQSSFPSVGEGKLGPRENPSVRGTAKEFKLLEPASDYYKRFAVDCTRQQIGVDAFIFGGTYADVASISSMSKVSSGTAYHYPDFNSRTYPSMVQKFVSELAHAMTRPLGLEAVLRVRATKGMTLNTYHGNFFVRSTDLLSMPNVSPDNAFALQIVLDDDLKDLPYVCFQSALLYTTTYGERRIRVHTLAVPVTEDLSTVFNGADQDAIVALMSKMAVDRAMTSKLCDARDAVLNMCIDLLKAYQEVAGTGQGLRCPLSLAYLPMLAHGLLKHPGLRLGHSTTLDERSDAHNLFKTMCVPQLVAYLLPRMYSLHDMSRETGLPDEYGNIRMPTLLRPSVESLVPHGLYLLENGMNMYLFVGHNVHPEIISLLFNLPNYQSVPPIQTGQTTHMTGLPELENELSVRVRNIVQRIRNQYTNTMLFVVVKEDDNRMRPVFNQYMVMDRNDSMLSYQEMLQHIDRALTK